MAKIIVTHTSPDLDGIPAIWLLKKFHPDFKGANVAFVPAGSTYNNEPVDSNPEVVHVDTGMGRFDHHQNSDFTCGAQLVYESLIREGYIDEKDEALLRMVKILTEIDHGYDTYKWNERENDRYDFMLHNVLSGWKMNEPGRDGKYVEKVIDAIEAVYKVLQSKVIAEGEIKGGEHFETRWGKSVAVYSTNGSILDTAIREGYAVAVTKDPKKGNVRITGSNAFNVDLTDTYEELKKRDPEASWFLHASNVLLRNGSSRNPTMKATKLDLSEVIEVLRKA